jgi:hypothetical protein
MSLRRIDYILGIGRSSWPILAFGFCFGIIFTLMSDPAPDQLISGGARFLGMVVFQLAAALWAVDTLTTISENLLKNVTSEIHASKKELDSRLHTFTSVASAGIVNVYWNPGEASEEAIKLIHETRSRLDLSGISLSSLLFDLRIEDAIRKALERGVRLRILLLNPESGLIDHYAEREGLRPDLLQKEINRSISILFRLSSSDKNTCLGLFDGPAALSIISTDTAVIIKPYLSTGHGRSSAQIKINAGPLCKEINEGFEELWHTASQPSLQE